MKTPAVPLPEMSCHAALHSMHCSNIHGATVSSGLRAVSTPGVPKVSAEPPHNNCYVHVQQSRGTLFTLTTLDLDEQNHSQAHTHSKTKLHICHPEVNHSNSSSNETLHTLPLLQHSMAANGHNRQLVLHTTSRQPMTLLFVTGSRGNI